MVFRLCSRTSSSRDCAKPYEAVLGAMKKSLSIKEQEEILDKFAKEKKQGN